MFFLWYTYKLDQLKPQGAQGRQLLYLKPGICLRCLATQQMRWRQQTWLNFGLFQSTYGAFLLCVPSLLWGEEPAATQHNQPQPVSARHTHLQEREAKNETEADRQYLHWCVFFFGLMCLRQPINGLGGVSSPLVPSPPPPPPPPGSWLIWELVVREDRDPAGSQALLSPLSY